ncbi:MAG TPA: hypothetical protein VGF84_15660, partial [Micromonosporaceae bacterium]
VLVIAALLGGLAVVAGYVRSEVLDTDTYVQTVAPLASDPVVQDALAQRLTTAIVDRTDITQLADNVASALIAKGAPAQLQQLVGPAIAGLTSFLDSKIKELLATPQFEAVWQDINRVAHEGLVTDLTGRNGRVQHSNGTTITIDLGEVLTALKPRLVAAGLGFVDKIPTVSIPFTLIQSDSLPKIRTYTRILDVVGTWLPYAALLIFLGGVLIAPNRRRGLLTGVTMLGIVTVLLLAATSVGRRVYLDRLPGTIQSPAAAAALFDAVLAYLIAALQALLVAVVIVLLVGLLAGPNRFARWLRRQGGRVLDAAGRGIGHAGGWTRRIGPALKAVRRPVEIALVLLGVVILILATHPTGVGVVVLALCLLAVFVVIEILARVVPSGGVPPPAEPA